MSTPSVPEGAEHIARSFHETYEALAHSYGYQTRRASAVPWDEVPEANKNLMIAVVAALLLSGEIIEGGPQS